MYNLINQKNDSDCVVACIAMFAQCSYEDVIKKCNKFRIEPRGISDENCQIILASLGFNTIKLPLWCWGSPGILALPSINLAGKSHVVFWTGDYNEGEILDPQKNREDKSFYDKDLVLKYSGFGTFITDSRHEDTKMYVEMEIQKLQKWLDMDNIEKEIT